MIKPGIYTIEAVQKYKDLLLTGKHETGTPEELRARSSREAPYSVADLLKECVSAKIDYNKARQAWNFDIDGCELARKAFEKAKDNLRMILENPDGFLNDEVLNKESVDEYIKCYDLMMKEVSETQYTRQGIAEEALKELESAVEDPAVADTYYNIREQGRALTRLMKQIVAVTGDKVDGVFTYPTHVFTLMTMYCGLPSVQATIEECYASCEKLAEILNKVLVKKESTMEKQKENNR